MAENNRKRIYIGPIEIAGYYGKLAKALSSEGFYAEFIPLKNHPFGYDGVTPNALGSLIRYCFANVKKGNPAARLFYSIITGILACGFFLRAVFCYDVFIFAAGFSLLPANLDLPILRALKKCIIFNMGHGSEMRPTYLSGIHAPLSCDRSLTLKAIKINRFLFNRTQRIERFSDYVIGAPFTSCYFGRRLFISWFALGLPTDIAQRCPGHPQNNSKIKILHAPSNPTAKGTSIIRNVVNKLKESDDRIEYVELSNCSNKQVLEHLAECDFVIDQLYSDTPMATLASEAAACRKPSIVGGYGLEELRAHVPPNCFPPSYCCRPEQLTEAIQWMIHNPHERKRLGEAAFQFVSKILSPCEVAKRYIRIIQGDVPTEWFLDPTQIIYSHGAGLDETNAKNNIKSIITIGGVDSLLFHGHPELRKALTMLSRQSG